MNRYEPIFTRKAELLNVHVYDNRNQMGLSASADVSVRIKELLSRQKNVRMIFAAAPSQNEFLDGLIKDSGIDWSRITVFHMDEYIGLPAGAPQAFSRFLRDRLFDQVHPGQVHLIDSTNTLASECRRYSGLLTEAPIDIVCLGIGENGHIAFNDPPVADFNDPVLVKPVELDHACRTQQVNDGCFPALPEVPTHAITLTIPALMSASALFCIVPGIRKREAVMRTVNTSLPISTDCPSTIMRNHPNCTLYTDRDGYDMTAGTGADTQ